MNEHPPLDPQTLKALLRLGDPARELSAEHADRLRRRLAAARPAPAPGRAGRWSPRLLLATAAVAACALALVVGLRRQGVEQAAVEPPAGERRYQIDFATPGGTRIVWTLIRNEPGTRRGR
jgi:hypothetical protein